MNTGLLSLLVHNHFGVLTKVSGLFGRRGYNIKALSVGETEDSSLSRITIVTEGDEMKLLQIYYQVTKLEEVVSASILPAGGAEVCELALIKLSTEPGGEGFDIVSSHDGYSIVRIVGASDEIDRAVEALRPCGIIEMSRTGSTALEKSENSLKKTIIGGL